MRDEVECFDGVALGEALGLVGDAPRPAEPGGVHPVREVVVGCSRVLVDPSTRGAHGGLGHESERDGRDHFLEASTQAHDDESRIEGGEHRRICLQAAEPLVPVDDLDVESVQALSCGLAGLGNGADERDAGAVIEAVKHVRQDEVGGGPRDLVTGRAQAHLQQSPVEADGVHARERTEVGVQEGPVVEPCGGVPSGEHALGHGVECGVGESADLAGSLGVVRAVGGG